MKYRLQTETFNTGIIIQTVWDELSGAKLSEYIIDVYNSDIKKALIRLGWKPPEGKWQKKYQRNLILFI